MGSAIDQSVICNLQSAIHYGPFASPVGLTVGPSGFEEPTTCHSSALRGKGLFIRTQAEMKKMAAIAATAPARRPSHRPASIRSLRRRRCRVAHPEPFRAVGVGSGVQVSTPIAPADAMQPDRDVDERAAATMTPVGRLWACHPLKRMLQAITAMKAFFMRSLGFLRPAAPICFGL